MMLRKVVYVVGGSGCHVAGSTCVQTNICTDIYPDPKTRQVMFLMVSCLAVACCWYVAYSTNKYPDAEKGKMMFSGVVYVVCLLGGWGGVTLLDPQTDILTL